MYIIKYTCTLVVDPKRTLTSQEIHKAYYTQILHQLLLMEQLNAVQGNDIH